jgi:hypothetical protein
MTGTDAGASLPPMPANEELAALYAADQRDRLHVREPDAGPSWASISARDEERREHARAILAAGGARTSEDYVHAAMLFQHGSEPDDYRMAYALAVNAVILDSNNGQAKWLAAAAMDRELFNAGRPQRYGTQLRSVDGGLWTVEPVDPSVTDEERAQWSVPPLSDARRRAEQRNAQRGPAGDAAGD